MENLTFMEQLMAPYQGGKSETSKVPYALLAFFLGGIGAHRFYAKQTMAGIAYLLLCWTGIPAMMALVDFIIALTRSTNENGTIQM